MKTKTDRKRKSQMLVHYLNLAEQGDKEAKEMVKQIAQTLFLKEEIVKKKKIIVTFPSGKKLDYDSLKEVSNAFKLPIKEIYQLVNSKKLDLSGRTYDYQIDYSENKEE